MSRFKKILLVLIVAFIAIQFVQPAHNKSEEVLPTDLANTLAVPNNIKIILQNACYDCHSNNTVYPWYSNIQPAAWLMARHIKNGKQKLDLSDFGSNTTRKQISKLKEMINQIKDDEMPIASYKMMHKDARLSKEQKKLVIGWISKVADSLSSGN